MITLWGGWGRTFEPGTDFMECKGRFQQLTSGSPALGPQAEKCSSASPGNVETAGHHCFTYIVKFGVGRIRIRRERGPGQSALSSAVKLAVPRVGKRPKDDASVFIDGMPKIHGEGENNDKEEEIDAKQRMQQPTESF
jgi:hypothetical protein